MVATLAAATAAVMAGEAYCKLAERSHADGALFEVGFARDGVEGAERDEVGVGLGEVEGHEDLAGSDDAGDAQFEVGDAAAARDDGDAVVRAEREALRRRRGSSPARRWGPCC